jgi:hypothetical protein
MNLPDFAAAWIMRRYVLCNKFCLPGNNKVEE